MKFLLLNPPSLPGKTTDRRQRCTANVPKGWSHPPLGLAYLASMLRKKGVEVCLLDSVGEEYDVGRVIEYVKKENPDYIISLIGLFTFPYDAIVLKKIKNATRVPLIVTGESSSAFPEKILRENKHIDYCFVGEPEAGIYDFIDMLNKRALLKKDLREKEIKEKDVNGLCFRKNKKIIVNNYVPVQNLDKLPFPARDLIKNKKYHCIPFFSEIYTDLLTSRGCPYKCKFCTAQKYWGMRFRGRSAKNVIKEVEECVKKYEIRNFFILDDLFLIDKKRLIPILKGFKKIKIKWALQTRVDLVNGKVLREMADSGCIYIHYGTESGSQRILDYYKKGITVEQIRNATRWAKAAGILTCATFIIGNPEEKKEDIEKTITLAKELRYDFIHFSPLIPFPSCEFFSEYKKAGILKHENFLLYTKPNIVFKPKYLTEKEINYYIRKAYKSTLFRPGFVLCHLKRIFLKGDFLSIKQMFTGAKWAIKTFFGKNE